MSTAVPRSPVVNDPFVHLPTEEACFIRQALATYLKKNNYAAGIQWQTLLEHERREIEHEAHKMRVIADLIVTADSSKKLAQALTPAELRTAAEFVRSGRRGLCSREDVAALLEFIAELKDRYPASEKFWE